jgi:hypothetical protein
LTRAIQDWLVPIGELRVSMPEIAAFNTRMGTEPTLAYLADLFRRRLLPPEPGVHA